MPTLVAHRGHPHRFPENSMASLRSAREHSARFVEVDVQLSADAKPFLHHDEDLLRCSGKSGLASDRTLRELTKMSCGEPGRFGETFADETIPSLKQAVEFLLSIPSLQAFVELKPQVLRQHPAEVFVRSVLRDLTPIINRCVIISFNIEILEAVNERARVGWILEEWSDTASEWVKNNSPEFLFVDRKKLSSDAPLWPGPWDWAVYSIDDAQTAIDLAQRGFGYIETNRIGELRGNPTLEDWT